MTLTISRPAIADSMPSERALAGSDFRAAGSATSSTARAPHGTNSRPAKELSTPAAVTPAGVQLGGDRAAGVGATPDAVSLLDPALALAADFLDDVERVKLANENRLR